MVYRGTLKGLKDITPLVEKPLEKKMRQDFGMGHMEGFCSVEVGKTHKIAKVRIEGI